MNKLTIRLLLVLGVMFSGHLAKGQTATDFHYTNSVWKDYLGNTVAGPTTSSGANTYYVDEGTNCEINANANISKLIVTNSLVKCTINVGCNLTADSVRLVYTTNNAILTVNGTLNIKSLKNQGKIDGYGTINLDPGTSLNETIIGPTHGYMNSFEKLNIISGNILISNFFTINYLNIGTSANVKISGYNTHNLPQVLGKLTIDGILTNEYVYAEDEPFFFEVKNLLVNSSGTFSSAAGNCRIADSIKIGGKITKANNINNYNYNLDNLNSPKDLVIFGNANVNFSDLSTSDLNYINIKSLTISDNGKFTVDKSLNLSTLTLTSGGSFLTSGTGTVTLNTPVNTIDGRLILSPNIHLTNPIVNSPFTLSGNKSAIGYFNRPDLDVIFSGTNDTVRNSTINQLIINSNATGIISDSATYKIGYIDATGPLSISSLLSNDSIKIAAAITLTGPFHTSKKVDIITGGSLISNGNLSMLDGSHLYFLNNNQITGNINWQRKYGNSSSADNGWEYFGAPFVGTTRISILGTVPANKIYINQYIESGSNTRWVKFQSTSSDTFKIGHGYNLAVTSDAPNDVLVFTGKPTCNDINVTGLTYTDSNGSWFDSQRGYNLVANPYTAPISVNAFFADNPNITSIYYWDNTGSASGQFVTRDYNNGTNIFTPSSGTPKNNDKIQSDYIAANQGFFVKVPSTPISTSIWFKGSEIRHTIKDDYLKSAIANYIRLQVENASGTKNDCIIKFDPAAADTFKQGMDTYKLVSTSYPLDIYSFKNTEAFAIQSRKPVTEDLYIPIGIIVNKNEKHFFTMNNFDALPQNINPYLLDNITKRLVNLRDSAYTVTLPIGTVDNRFELILKSGSFTTEVISNISKNEITIFKQDGLVYINFSQDAKQVTIEASDITGRIIQHQYISDAQGKIEINGKFNLNNIYIFKISGKNISQINKLLIQ